tara:strand:- start:238 stop:1377 length:1140 start_codon:yes stop_codon:yes gene_type:complete
MKIISVVGARPNLMKIAPFINAINVYNEKFKPLVNHYLVHTGQHYDTDMSDIFFKQLSISTADKYLKIGSGSHAQQVGKTMIEFEKVLEIEKPDWVVVVGDVNATLACSVTTKKQKIKLCHIEAGLRSNDITMPEEINRIVTDSLSDLLLVPDKFSFNNLIKEGKNENNVKMIGNIMIDTFEKNRSYAIKMDLETIIKKNTIKNKTLFNDEYVLLTLHRPSNVDNESKLCKIVDFLTNKVTTQFPVIWPVHPRTKKQLERFHIWENLIRDNSIIILKPIGYFEMIKLNMEAKIVLTDSGGLQEESCVIGTPCLSLRSNTERPITLIQNGGTVSLVDEELKNLNRIYKNLLIKGKNPSIPEKWDGKTAERCLSEILKFSI